MEVKLIYVEEFNYKLERTAKDLLDHPREGEIYRAVKRQTTPMGEVYQMFFDEPGETTNLGMFLPGLIVDNKLFKFKMREVNVEDILDLELNDATYIKLDEWGADFGKGLSEEHLNIPVMGPEDEMDSIKALAEKISSAMREASEKTQGGPAMSKLHEKDKDMSQAVRYLIKYLASTYDDKYEVSLIGTPAKKLIYSEMYGKGVNVFNAIKYLQRYMTDGLEKSNNHKDVLKAVHYLLLELTRLMIYGKVEA